MEKCVLLIDDNRLSNFITATLIRECKLCNNIRDFESPVDALNYLSDRTKQPGIEITHIFVDIDMPEMDGFQFVERYEKIKSALGNEPRVIMLSSTLNEKEIEQARAHPAIHSYTSKPLTKEKLSEIF